VGFTSPAVNVMLFQPSDENSEPTWAMHKAAISPNTVSSVSSGAPDVYPCGCQGLMKFDLPAALHPTIPTTITPNKAVSLAEVNMF
jgi:hypothetical protein